MTDLLPAGPLGEMPSILPELPSIDTSSLDMNLRTIRSVEQSWRLPEIPDSVKLDLASFGTSTSELGQFLNGLDSDLSGNDSDGFVAEPDLPPLTVIPSTGTQFGPINTGFWQQARSMVSQLAGDAPPETLDMNAAQRWKLEAIKRGYLPYPEDGRVDSTWSGDMYSIVKEMRYDLINERFRGDRVGAMPIRGTPDKPGIVDIIGEWVTPSGLLKAATELDFWWDFGAIGKEWNDWDDKWRRVADSDGPWDFAKNLVDAATGPIDDVVFPVINVVLMFTGVGSLAEGLRLGVSGARAARAISAADKAADIYRAGRTAEVAAGAYRAGRVSTAIRSSRLGAVVERVLPAAENVAELGRPSMTSSWLMRRNTPALVATGTKMAQWRALPQVIAARRTVQVGARLGLVSKVENDVFNTSGVSLADFGVGQTLRDSVIGNPVVSNGVDYVFAPYNIAAPGTYVNGGRAAVANSFKYLGNWKGRAVAGGVAGMATQAAASPGEEDDWTDPLLAGAAAATVFAGLPSVARAADWAVGQRSIPALSNAVRKVARFGRVWSWEPVTENERFTTMWLDALRQRMDPEQYQQFTDKVRQGGFKQAMAEVFKTDKTTAGGAMFYVMLAGAIDYAATHMASLTAAEEGSRSWYNTYFGHQNRLTAAVSTFGPSTTPEYAAWRLAVQGARRGRLERFRTLVESFRGEDGAAALAEAIAHHNEQAVKVMRQILGDTGIEGLSDDIVESMGAFAPEFADMMRIHMTNYIAKAMDSFGEWGKYQPAVSDLGGFVGRGVFDDARLLPAISSVDGRTRLNLVEAMDEIEPEFLDTPAHLIVSGVTDRLFVEPTTTWDELRRAGFFVNPMAMEVTPARSRFAMALRSTKSKQDLLIEHDAVKRVIEAVKSMSKAASVMTAEGNQLIRSVDLSEVSQYTLAGMLRAASATEDQAKAVQVMARALKFAKSQGFDVSGVPELALESYVRSLSSDARWWREFDMPEIVTSTAGKPLGGLELLEERAKKLKEIADRSAAEIDTGALITSLREKGMVDEADELEAFITAHGERYKVVFGHDFMMPDELVAHHDVFTDLNERHMNAITLGNFFGRRHPAELARNVEIARRRAVARHMGRVLGEDLDPEDARVTGALSDVYRLVLDPELERNRSLVEDIYHQSFFEKRATGMKTAFGTRSVQDLGLGRGRKKILAALEAAGYDKKVAEAVWLGIKEGRYAEFKDQGLYAIEAKLRSKNQIIGALNVIGSSTEAGKFSARRAAAPALVGAAQGFRMGQSTAPEGEDGMAQGLIGAGIGAVAGVTTSLGANRLANRIDPAGWARIGYVADGLASYRDSLRFTLSPFFDFSRYTEAAVLGQIAAPRLEDGTRAVLPLNQSPRTLLRRLQKKHGSTEGQRMWNAIQDEWRMASKGKFDVNMLEETQHQFEEIGILGFNPTRWMMSTFHYMREAGMSSEAAYDAVRNMYTYGVKSRSPFEQSVNFILFPFSFSKKTVTHAAEFLSDNTLRSVLLHDTIKAYELLDENYNLDEWVKQHLPVLEKLQQLNLFAFGLSPGRLGGINKPFLDAAGIGPEAVLDPAERKGLVFNLMMPLGINVGEGVSKDQLIRLMNKSIPAINDLRYMLEDLKSQGHVIFDPSHKVRWAQTRDAINEWNEYKTSVAAALGEYGLTWNDMYTAPELANMKLDYDLKRQELERKYPGWVESRDKAVDAAQDLERERKQRKLNIQDWVRERVGEGLTVESLSPEAFTALQQEALADPTVATDWLFYLFSLEFEYAESWVKEYLGKDASMDEMGPAQFEYLRGVAIDMAASNPNFLPVYDRFFGRFLGPITSTVE